MIKSNLEQRIGNWYMINPVKCDELIAQGQTCVYMGKQLGVSHVAVVKYIRRTGQHPFGEEHKERVRLEKDEQKAVLQEERRRQKRLEKERLIAEEKKQEVKLEVKLEQTVLEAVRENLTTSPEELSEYTSIESKKIKKVLSRYGISRGQNRYQTIPIIVPREVSLDNTPQEAYNPEQKRSILKLVQKDKPVAIEQVRRKTELDLETIETVLRDEKMLLDLPSTDYRLDFDMLIAKGLTASEIARRLGFSRQMIDQYAKATGQFSFIKKSQRKAKENKTTFSQEPLPKAFVQRQYQLAEQEYGRYSSRALDIYYLGRGITRRIGFLGKLLRLAKVYAEAEDRGERLSYQELGDRSELGLPPPEVYRDLFKMGLKSMHWTKGCTTKVIPEQLEAIRNSYFTQFSAVDISYFLNLPSTVVQQHFTALKKIKGRRERTRIFLQTVPNDGKGMQKSDHLNYHLASQVYELDDYTQREGTSFTIGELSEGIGIKPELVEYARLNRPKIEDNIKRLLTILYPGEEINKPYQETKT